MKRFLIAALLLSCPCIADYVDDPQAAEIKVRSGNGCTTYESDLRIVRPDNHDFAEALKACSGLGGLNIKCFTGKVPNLSGECVGCFAQMTSCTVDNCKMRCMFSPRGVDCRQCTREFCGATMQNCSGLSPTELPDFQR